MGYAAGDANLYRYTFNNPVNLTDPTGKIVPLIAAVILATKVIDYGLTAYDVWQSTQVIADPCSTPEEILFASLNLALSVTFEFIEPNDFLPIGVPADDGARRLVMREARRAFDDEGMEGVVRVLRNNLGDEAGNVLRELGLEEYIDDAVRAVCSFSGDTLVSTINGWEAISTLDEGDWVLAYDEATDTIGYYPVLATWVHEDPLIILLTIDGETIETTPEHPFRIAAGDWVAAGELQAGDWIQQPDGAYGTVEAVDLVYRLQPMYNLTVAFAHTYFVSDGQWLVHNACWQVGDRTVAEVVGNTSIKPGPQGDVDHNIVEKYAKFMSEGQFDWNNMQKFGENDPIKFWRTSDGTLVLMEGHHRFLAAQLTGTPIPFDNPRAVQYEDIAEPFWKVNFLAGDWNNYRWRYK